MLYPLFNRSALNLMI